MTKVGDRIELVDCSDPYTKLTPGSKGTVSLVDSMGTVHVAWDSGSNLGLIPGEDSWRVLPNEVTYEGDEQFRQTVDTFLEEVGGVDDGFTITSDADPGL